MKNSQGLPRLIFAGALMCVTAFSFPGNASAHCDTLDGPVIADARKALEKEEVTPVLKWVGKKDEEEIKEQFQKTLAVRKQGKESQELADRYFFETLVRIHRSGEGAPYTGLKAGPVEPIIQAADKALESGSVDALVKQVSDSASGGIRKRFERLKEAKKHSEQSVEKGREFVSVYVEFTHYVERLYGDAAAACPCEKHAEHHKSMPTEHRHHEH